MNRELETKKFDKLITMTNLIICMCCREVGNKKPNLIDLVFVLLEC